MKKINPEDLVVGQECYIKFTVANEQPLHLSDMAGNTFSLSGDESIYTHEESNDIELEMLVNVANRMQSDFNLALANGNKSTFPTYEQFAGEAHKFITACKNQLK